MSRAARWITVAVAFGAIASGCSASAKAEPAAHAKYECQFSSVRFGTPSGDSQRHVTLILTSLEFELRPCSMPTKVTVYLIRPNRDSTGVVWELQHTAKQGSVTLQKPGAVQADLTYLPDETATGSKPDYVMVITPNPATVTANAGRGSQVKTVLRIRRDDPNWLDELAVIRSLVVVDQRR